MDDVFIIDPARCIGCQACVQACAECGTHRGVSMIHLEYVSRADTVQTTPQVCMHCEVPMCAMACPADAIKKTPDGVVQTSLKPRCVGCSNCVLACPFGVPKYNAGFDQMTKCDMCYDRTSLGKKPMCATVCPSEALYFGPREKWRERRRGRLVNRFRFGRQEVRTKVYLVMPEGGDSGRDPRSDRVDIRIEDVRLRPRRDAAADRLNGDMDAAGRVDGDRDPVREYIASRAAQALEERQ